MSIGLKSNNDGSGALQVNGTDRVTLSTAGVMSVPAGVTANLTGDVTGAANKLSTASGSAPSYSARAWVNFNGTGTVAILASGNVSSITDRAVGQYTVNFATAMPDANYASLGTHNAVGGDVSCTFIGNASYGAANTASAATVNTTTFSALTDASRIYVAIFR